MSLIFVIKFQFYKMFQRLLPLSLFSNIIHRIDGIIILTPQPRQQGLNLLHLHWFNHNNNNNNNNSSSRSCIQKHIFKPIGKKSSNFKILIKCNFLLPFKRNFCRFVFITNIFNMMIVSSPINLPFGFFLILKCLILIIKPFTPVLYDYLWYQ